MQILADENIAMSVVRGLRARGFDVVWIKEMMRGAKDPVVLARAVAEDRILLTFDKDFGELAFRQNLPASCGIILLRITPKGAKADTETIIRIVSSRSDWMGAFG